MRLVEVVEIINLELLVQQTQEMEDRVLDKPMQLSLIHI